MVWHHRNRKKAPKTMIFSGNFTRVLDGIGRVLDVFWMVLVVARTVISCKTGIHGVFSTENFYYLTNKKRKHLVRRKNSGKL